MRELFSPKQNSVIYHRYSSEIQERGSELIIIPVSVFLDVEVSQTHTCGGSDGVGAGDERLAVI